MKHTGSIAVLMTLLALPALAGDVRILDAKARQQGGNDWSFSVTLEHGDTGWDHYADAWRVKLADGTILGTRVLLHPHVNEQPFTRSLGGVAIPAGTSTVIIEAKDSQHGWAKETFSLTLP